MKLAFFIIDKKYSIYNSIQVNDIMQKLSRDKA